MSLLQVEEWRRIDAQDIYIVYRMRPKFEKLSQVRKVPSFVIVPSRRADTCSIDSWYHDVYMYFWCIHVVVRAHTKKDIRRSLETCDLCIIAVLILPAIIEQWID
jgi:hypothetical protein